MRATILFSTLVFLGGCPPRKPQTVIPFQPDSPIIVTDANSVHFRKEDGFLILGKSEATVQLLSPATKIDMTVVGCYATQKPNPSCTVNSYPIPTTDSRGKPVTFWVLFLFDTNGAQVGKLTWPGPQGATDRIQINLLPKKSKFDIEDPGDDADQDPHDGPGLIHPSVHLGSASLSVNSDPDSPVPCPTTPGCKMRIIQ